AAQVERGAGQGLVHRQGEAVARDAALVAQRLPQRLAQGDAGVLDGVVLVDVQVALGAHLQRDAAMLADLVEHVVEERQPGRNLGVGDAVQVQLDPDPGLLRVALHHRAARRVGQFMGDAGPIPFAAELLRAQLEAADAQVGGELQVGLAVANHGRGVEVDAAVAQVVLHQAEPGLARGRVVGGPAAVDQDLAEHDALALEYLQHEVVGAVETLAWIGLAAQPVLVADDPELEAGVAQLQHGRDHAAHEAQLLVGVDLEIRGFLDQGAVAIDEQDPGGHQRPPPPAASPIPGGTAVDGRRADSTDSTRAFCSGVPMVMRRASPSAGAARWSRTTMPAPSSASNAACASSKRTSRKLPCEGYTRRTPDRGASAAASRARSLRTWAMRAAVAARA